MAATYTNNWGQMSAAVNSNNAMNMPAGQRSPAENTLLAQCGNRTIYLGHLHPDTSVEEICKFTNVDVVVLHALIARWSGNTVRGGILQNIRFMPESESPLIAFHISNTRLIMFKQQNTSASLRSICPKSSEERELMPSA